MGNINTVKVATSSHEALNTARVEIENRSLLFDKDESNLFIKYNDVLVPIGGTQKQNLLEPGKNIEIVEEVGNTVIKTSEDVDFDTVTLSPNDAETMWKGGQLLADMEGNSIKLLFKETTIDALEKATIGGEVFIEINGGALVDHHNISLSSTGSRSYVGSTDSYVKSTLVKCKYNGEYYYGIRLPVFEIEETVTDTRSFSSSIGFRFVGNTNYRYTIDLGNGTSANDFRLTNNLNGVYYRSNVYANWAWTPLSTFVQKMIPALYNDEEALRLSGLRPYLNSNYYFFCAVRYQSNGRCAITDVGLAPSPSFTLVSGTSNYSVYGFERLMGTTLGTELGFTFNSDNVGGAANSGRTVASGWTTPGGFGTFSEDIDVTTATGVVNTITPENAKMYFNGWLKVPESLSPPESYNDSSFEEILPLADEANQGTSDIVIGGSVSTGGTVTESTIEIVWAQMPSLGVDADPNTLKIIGTITRSVLNLLAEKCRGDPDKQVVLDLSEATLESSITVWDWQVFKDCHSLRGIKLPPNLTEISDLIFQGCIFLRYVDFTTATSLTTLIAGDQDHAFFEGTRVFTVILNNTVQSFVGNFVEGTSVAGVYFKHAASQRVSGNGTAGWLTMRTNNFYSWQKYYVADANVYYQYNVGDLASNSHIVVYNPDDVDWDELSTKFR